ncbi:uncharacterized protein MONOS_14309 [Monocercomonoides exilis]|uniref:uncharacterized protein n=1 Tax=Monocercomonoides exilis TaxID=2049356 RepID=UPI003559F0C1|nr:hypothetical protein MONOS_14309 [Monocercomonoides exilis]|eukprot:MONOS_14309.1-p1 / transcript=MONOS_14309.1 / gene=MONOS_14309 / organism=Monocercomonoides_exilis_PA203 / gene_product=unspecified product / transcript_product=unspecified product / location=Mono_scaffold00977:8306-8713(-) / protein_length=136 / sequence_SO=supercontig / SO=protein_coding / is_pseudo=false
MPTVPTLNMADSTKTANTRLRRSSGTALIASVDCTCRRDSTSSFALPQQATPIDDDVAEDDEISGSSLHIASDCAFIASFNLAASSSDVQLQSKKHIRFCLPLVRLNLFQLPKKQLYLLPKFPFKHNVDTHPTHP